MNIKKNYKNKIFEPRNSYYTDLFENNVQVMREMLLVFFVFIIGKNTLLEYYNGERLTFGTKYLVKGFSNFGNLAMYWIYVFSLMLLVYPLFCLWLEGVRKLSTNRNLINFWNKLWIYFIFIFVFIIIWPTFKFQLLTSAIFTNLLIIYTQVVFGFKVHAFLRDNCEKVLASKPRSRTDIRGPTFYSFLYFLFAPTFIYRDEYPRTASISYIRVIKLFMEFIYVALWISIVIEYSINNFRYFGLKKETYSSLLIKCADLFITTPIFLALLQYIHLHIVPNINAELLRFADRQFYMDWWNAKGMDEYYRSWNLLIHEYLHAYYYQDILVYTSNRIFAMLGAFFVSVFFHEYIATLVFGFNMPIMGMQHIFSIFLVLIHSRSKTKTIKITVKENKITESTSNCRKYSFNLWKAMFLFGSFVFLGIQNILYSMEYFARQNCAVPNKNALSFIKPRMLTCNGLNL